MNPPWGTELYHQTCISVACVPDMTTPATWRTVWTTHNYHRHNTILGNAGIMEDLNFTSVIIKITVCIHESKHTTLRQTLIRRYYVEVSYKLRAASILNIMGHLPTVDWIEFPIASDLLWIRTPARVLRHTSCMFSYTTVLWTWARWSAERPGLLDRKKFQFLSGTLRLTPYVPVHEPQFYPPVWAIAMYSLHATVQVG